MAITAVEGDGDLLVVTVSHGGGCAEHTYQACWNGAIAKSLPPQATIELRHDGHGDTCEAELSETLEIDISALREKTGGSVVVHVGGERVRFE